MRDKFEKLFKKYEELIGKTEKEILSSFKEALEASYILLGEQFRKYEIEGALSYEEMTKYKRLEKFYHELDLIINEGYKKAYKSMSKGLKDTYSNSYNGVRDIVELTKNKTLIPIVKDEVIQRALTNDISGLKWTDRMGIHRDTAVLKIRETVAQGLHQGETYSTMAKRLNESLSRQVVNPLRIARTEGHRVFSEARKDSLDNVKDKVKMTKTWITSKDERVRSTHSPMNGVTIPYEDDFIMPDGAKGFGPGMIGSPEHDINCRCDWIIDFVENNSSNNYDNDDIIETEIVIGKSLGAKSFNYKIWVEDKGYYNLTEDTKITSIYVFAGKGTKKPVRVAEHLSKQYGGKAENWKHVRGNGYVDFEGTSRKAELHWFENKDVGRIKIKVKRWFDES